MLKEYKILISVYDIGGITFQFVIDNKEKPHHFWKYVHVDIDDMNHKLLVTLFII